MGLVLSRFRAKLSTKEQLEKIDSEIQSIEEYKWSTLRQQKNLVAMVFFSSGLVYAIVAVLFYFYFLPMSSTLYDKCFYGAPLFVLPAIAYLLQKALQWYYRWVIEGKEDKLKELRKEKRRILDKVMDTETYKVARELLEKFDPNSLKDKSQSTPLLRPSDVSLRFRGSPTTNPGLRPNTQYSTPSRSNLPPSSPVMNNSQIRPSVNPGPVSGAVPRPPMVMMAPRRLPRPILPQDRGVVEKVVDYVVGDGPSNRFALICCYCHSHNGMSLKDEFEYLAFRCCYCNGYNPARKARPFAPQLSLPAPPVIDEPESDAEKSTRCDSPAKKALNIVDVSSPDKDGSKNNTEDTLVTDDEGDDDFDVNKSNGDHIKGGETTVNYKAD